MVSLEYYQEAVNIIASGPRPEQLAAFKPSPLMEARVRELLDKEKDGVINEEEKVELDHFLFFDHIMRMIKARALDNIVAK